MKNFTNIFSTVETWKTRITPNKKFVFNSKLSKNNITRLVKYGSRFDGGYFLPD